MYAVIETGGKQYRVEPGASIEVETLPGEIGGEVEFDRVIAVMDGDQVKAGAATQSARVKGTITEHEPRRQRRERSGIQVQTQETIQAHHWASAELHPRSGE